MRNDQLEEDLKTQEAVCEQLRNSNQELIKAQERIEAEYRALLETERGARQQLAEELMALHADAEETTKIVERLMSTTLDQPDVRLASVRGHDHSVDRRMTSAALGLILIAAVLHALWNLVAKRAGGGPAFVWLYGTISALLLLPVALVLVFVQHRPLTTVGLAFTLLSAFLHAGYFLVLQEAYREGDLSVVYPVARGTGPVLSTIAAISVLGERPSALALSGAILVAVAVFALAKPARSSTADTKRAISLGLVTGVLIAGFTICDKQAVGPYGVPPAFQQFGTSVGISVILAPLAMRRRAEIRRHLKHHRLAILAIGVLVPAAYILVLTAMSFTPVSYIAPAREVSILIGTLMGTHLLSEGQAGRRIAAAVTMVFGLAALALG